MGRNYFLYVSLVLTIAIAVGSLISLGNGLGVKVPFFDKFLHASAYFLLTISWLLTYRLTTNLSKSTVLIALSVFIYGIIIEILQGAITTNRMMELSDVFANFTGIAVATLFFTIVLKKK